MILSNTALCILQPNYTAIIHTCNLWRNFDDIQDSWDSVQRIIDYYGDNQDEIVRNAGPGHWNDPDMVRLCSGMCDGIMSLLRIICYITGQGVWVNYTKRSKVKTFEGNVCNASDISIYIHYLLVVCFEVESNYILL